MKVFLLSPYENNNGNLLWSPYQSEEFKTQISDSISKVMELEYWASAFPEGDGIAFKSNVERSLDQIIQDFQKTFPWADIKQSTYREAIEQLAIIDNEMMVNCIITIPLIQIRIETSFEMAGNYRYLANEENDTITVDRISDFNSEQIEFELEIKYGDLIKLNNHSLDHDNYVINLCLDQAERGMDLIRLKYSSFTKPEFTPNPVGQLRSGFYEVQISPKSEKPISIKAKVYGGISKPLSVSNNWLGPEVEDIFNFNDYKLSEIFVGHVVHELGNHLISSFRNCRQAFYTLGDEAKFLSLIFSIDAIASPKIDWTGWKHRSYIAALICNGNPKRFSNVLKSFDYLYTDIRNMKWHS